MEGKGLIIANVVILLLGLIFIFIAPGWSNKIVGVLLALSQTVTLIDRRKEIKSWWKLRGSK